ncbi:probable gamma-secretase subunit PEN-2 [Andrographis paniculata]|uniref:probable gamma-secretase subunit PEN-2 n=1 Tax=Andrographis paniculata TaxID=175694 RepID=UPI0021E8524D|nr:probable gamma-secretase subunit PEN-2 [Andrographis paniculata]
MDANSRIPPAHGYSNPHNTAAAATSILLPTATADDASASSRRLDRADWPTIDGPLGLSHEESLTYASRFFKLGFLFLPMLWGINCFYFWPILRHPSTYPSHPRLRHYLVGSAIGFSLFAAVLCSWAFTFAIGGERLFGHIWSELVMYNFADKYGLTGWI